jgi:lycopene beta-cyclase
MNRAPERDGRIYRLGVAAGAARPSTGYAFRSIVETSRSLAGEIASRLQEPTRAMPQVKPPLHLGRRARFFDAVFLELLLREPEQVPRALLRLFARNRSDRVFRFLSGASTIRDEISVLASLPWEPFVKALLRLAGGRRPREESPYPRPMKYPSGSISSRRIRSSS